MTVMALFIFFIFFLVHRPSTKLHKRQVELTKGGFQWKPTTYVNGGTSEWVVHAQTWEVRTPISVNLFSLHELNNFKTIVDSKNGLFGRYMSFL